MQHYEYFYAFSWVLRLVGGSGFGAVCLANIQFIFLLNEKRGKAEANGKLPFNDAWRMAQNNRENI